MCIHNKKKTLWSKYGSCKFVLGQKMSCRLFFVFLYTWIKMGNRN